MTYTSESLLKHVDALIDACEIELKMYEAQPPLTLFKTSATFLSEMQETAKIELEYYKQLKGLLLNENTTTE